MFASMAAYVAVLFACCMACHGELYRLRPPASRLSAYYLMIAAGGAFGGLLVAGAAPLVFRGYFELNVGLFATALLVSVALCLDPGSLFRRGRLWWRYALLCVALAGLGAGLYVDAATTGRHALTMKRNFYGVLKVEEYSVSDPEQHYYCLAHGGTTHGIQYASPEKRRVPTSYYHAGSGVGRAMLHFPRQNRRIGVVGLGTGTMAAWGRAGDTLRFYEINEAVVKIARERFSFLADSPAAIEVVMGDARLNLEREPDQKFDILVLDAFSSDAIPAHLLTREAFQTYRRHLRPDGVMAVHISNRYLNLKPVIRRTAEALGYQAALIVVSSGVFDDDEPEEAGSGYDSDWVLLSNNAAFLSQPEIRGVASEFSADLPAVEIWTDDKSDLFSILELDSDSWLAWLRRRAG